MSELDIIRNLVDLQDLELNEIYKNVKENDNIQLLDYKYKISLDENTIEKLNSIDESIPEKRKQLLNDYKKVIQSSRTIDYNLSNLRVNPFTEFENNPSIFFGVGGGSKELCKGLPFDVLNMILTSEDFRQKMNIEKCYILLANRITYTNIPKNPEFSKESIDNVMETERQLFQNVLNKFGFSDHWQIVMQTDMDKFLNSTDYENYEKLIQEGDKSQLVGGHHYAIEMADINAMVGRNSGGIKMGWFIRNIDTVNGGYIMDEQPFHARFVLFMAKEKIINKVSLAYANAGARLYPGPTGALEKESPYICYQPQNRLLLSPYENAFKKLKLATENNGGLNYKYLRDLYCGIINLFEKYVLKEQIYNLEPTLKNFGKQEFKCEFIAKKVQYILDFIYSDERELYKKIWSKGFKYNKSEYENV